MAVTHLVVVGEVQGVGFRWFVRERARRLNLDGWVRNRDDGSVELLASGTPEAVREISAIVHRGPPGASVAEVRAIEGAETEVLPDPFTILR